MAAKVTYKDDPQFPIEIELKGQVQVFTKKAAIELKNKLQSAIDEMLENEANNNE